MGGSSKARDIVLILAVLALGALAMLPGREGGGSSAPPDAAGLEERKGETQPAVEPRAANGARGVARSSPAAPEGTRHGLFPLVPSSEWSYRTSGPSELVPAAIWTMRLADTVDPDGTVAVAAGFGDIREPGRVLEGDGWFFIDVLPLLEPVEFAGNRPRRVSGTLLPAPEALVENAAWDLVLERRVQHTIRDEMERPVTRPMRAVQRERASMEGWDEVSVPAGVFRAARLEWRSRLELFAGRRQVFDGLTLEPFRAETMWVAPGIGIVKRQVTYAGAPRSMTFQLERYNRPGS